MVEFVLGLDLFFEDQLGEDGAEVQQAIVDGVDVEEQVALDFEEVVLGADLVHKLEAVLVVGGVPAEDADDVVREDTFEGVDRAPAEGEDHPA